jgi:CCR4-NOT transcriptional regulation complex NOT5 subunit
LLYVAKKNKNKEINFENVASLNFTDDPQYALECCQGADFVIDSLDT